MRGRAAGCVPPSKDLAAQSLLIICLPWLRLVRATASFSKEAEWMVLLHCLIRHPRCCREELAAEADVLCLLAKVDRQQFSMEGAVAGASEESGQIAVVVQEGLQVLMPMAGKACLLCLSCVLHDA